MKKLLLVLCLLSTVSTHAKGPVTLQGVITKVTDGDTVTISTSSRAIKIRLNCIDAPELSQEYGEVARETLNSLLYRQNVTVTLTNKDQYDRFIGTIYKNGNDINLAQVKNGHARVYTAYCRDKKYYIAEKEAKKLLLGLWGADTPQESPWEYRIKQKYNKALPDLSQFLPKTINAPAPDISICNKKRTCKEMSDCNEAKFYFTQCGLSHLDSNNDGIPCNSLCN